MFTIEYEYIFDSESYYQLNTVKNKKESWKLQPKKITTFNLRIGNLNKRFTATDTNCNLSDHKVNNQKNYIISEYFWKYHK